MTGAESKTLRESLGLPVSWLAAAAGVRQRTVSYWESGHELIPQDVEALLLKVEAQLLDLLKALKSPADGSATYLIRYRTDADLWAFEPSLGHLPASAYAAMIGWQRWALISQGLPFEIIWMEPEEYRSWLGARDDSAAMRQAWASNLATDH